MDGMGKLPGVTRGFLKEVATDPRGPDAFDAWEQQTEKDRNYQFNEAVKARPLENNEQLHWESVPLDQSLAALVCSNSAFSDISHLCKQDSDGNHFIPFAGREVPVIVADKSDSLLTKLAQRNVTNGKAQVRLGE